MLRTSDRCERKQRKLVPGFVCKRAVGSGCGPGAGEIAWSEMNRNSRLSQLKFGQSLFGAS